MDFTLVVAAVGPLIALCLHELSHLAVARSRGPLTVTLSSCLPFRVNLEFDSPPSLMQLRVIALAPLLVGLLLAGLAFQTGLWAHIQQLEPYYLSYLLALNWAVLSHLSLTDLRLAWNPDAAQHARPTPTAERT